MIPWRREKAAGTAGSGYYRDTIPGCSSTEGEESDPLVASGLYSAKIGPLFIHADHNFFQNRCTRPANTFSHQPAGNCAAKNISLYDYVDLCCLPARKKGWSMVVCHTDTLPEWNIQFNSS